MAIVLQQVDGSTPSIYLKTLVNKNIQGEITDEMMEEFLHIGYKNPYVFNK